MFMRPHRAFVPLALPLLLGALAHAEPIPAPPKPLRDYDGRGYIQIDIPAQDADATTGKFQSPGIKTWIAFRQAFVRPDRLLMDVEIYGARQRTLIQGSTEYTWSPSLGYTIKRVYKNVDRSRENPVGAAQLSMAALSAALLEVKGGRKLPAEDLDRVQQQLQARQEVLKKVRSELRASKNPADLPRAESAALESARIADDLKQIPLRRAHPYDVWEFENEEILGILAGRGMAGPAAADLLRGGKTRVWLTREEGMPLKVEAMGREGQPVVYLSFLDLKVNQGMLPGELVLGAPPLTRMITAEADLRRSDWETEMERQVQTQIERLQQERARAAQGQLTAPTQPGKKR